MRSSNWPRYFVPATTPVISSVIMRLLNRVGEQRCMTIISASPSTMALLPTPGSPIRMGLFFLRRPKISTTRSISRSRPTQGSNLPNAAWSVKSVPKLSNTGVLDLTFCCWVVVVVADGPLLLLEELVPVSASSSSKSSSGSPIPLLTLSLTLSNVKTSS